jgi:hypothetical protein
MNMYTVFAYECLNMNTNISIIMYTFFDIYMYTDDAEEEINNGDDSDSDGYNSENTCVSTHTNEED